jgi:putative transposase
MSVRTEHSGEAVWSITFTCYEWISLFEITNGYDLVYDWFNYFRPGMVSLAPRLGTMPRF